MAPMLKPGLEMILGVNNDPQFGPMVMVGLGGVFVELFRDAAVYPAPLGKEEALDMLRFLKAYRMLEGYRGGVRYDIDALCETLVSVGKFAAANKDTLKELDKYKNFHSILSGFDSFNTVIAFTTGKIRNSYPGSV